MSKKDDWPTGVARQVAREVRRYRQMRRPRMSVQQLADRTDELGMPIPRSVLANLESGRRDTVSVAEVLVLAAALNVTPIELICPVGFDKQIEVLPGRVVDPLAAMRWITGEWQLDIVAEGTILGPSAPLEQSGPHLAKNHDELINHLRTQEASAGRAIAGATAEGADEGTRATVSYWMSNLADFRRFIYEALRNNRAEMRKRGMLLPDLPADIDLEEGPETASTYPLKFRSYAAAASQAARTARICSGTG